MIETVDDGTTEFSVQYVYGGASLWELYEQYDPDNEETLLTHVYGLGIDDEISYFDESPMIPIQHWTHRDDQNTLTSVTDDSGDVEERYEYGDYGLLTILDPSGVVIASTAVKAHHFYTGRSLIAGVGLYDYRYRVMDPVTGRFGQRDPLGYIDSMNVYTYIQSAPFNMIDPSGCYSTYYFIPNADGYSVTVTLNQPVPGTAAVDGESGPGHAWITISTSFGFSISNGLYPENLDFLNPENPEDILKPTGGNVRDDGKRADGNVEAKYNADPLDGFLLVLTLVADRNNPPDYDIDDYNCMDYVADKMKDIDPDFPTNKVPTFPGFPSVSSPGITGEDLVKSGKGKRVP